MSGQDKRQNSAGRGEEDYSKSENSEEDLLVDTPLEQVLAPRSKFEQPFRYPSMPIGCDDPVPSFPSPPQGYAFQNTGSSELAKVRQTNALLTQLNKKNTKPETKEEFEAKGSIIQPPDGEKVKRGEDDQCLTCINQGARCHGTDVEDGKCKNCRGGGKKMTASGKEKSSRATRTCRWKEPAKNIWTYKDHIIHYHPERQISENTKIGRFEREITKRNLWPTIWDIPPQSHEGQILRWIAVGMVRAGGLSNDSRANLDALIEITMRRMSFVGLARNIPGEQTRREVIAAVNEIYLRLLLAREEGAGITPQQIRDLLPDGLPRK